VPFVSSPVKFRCFNGGFGAGKTFGGAQEAWAACRAFPGSLGLIVAPTYPELRDYTQRTFFSQLTLPDGAPCDADNITKHPLVENFNKSEQTLKLVNGCEIFFRSADKPSSLVGSTVDWFWLDEPASCAAVTWKYLQGRLRGKVGPRRGWCTGTPKGFNWVYREFAERPRKDHALFTASTMDNAENLPPDYIAAMLESYTGVFARGNIYGEFVGFEGQVYEFSRSVHVLPSDWQPAPDVPVDRVADFGTNAPTVWLWVQEIAGTVYIFDELEVRRQPVSTIAQEVLSRWLGLLHGQDFGDIAGAQHDSNLQSFISNYAREGIRIRTRFGGAIKAGIEVVTRFLNPSATIDGALRPRLLVHPRCARLIAAFETYHWPEDKDGNPVGDEPEKDGVSDHSMDAVRYWFVNRHPEQFRRIPIFSAPVAGQRSYQQGAPSITQRANPLLPPSEVERMGIVGAATQLRRAYPN